MVTKSKSKKPRGTTIRVSGPETGAVMAALMRKRHKWTGEQLYGIYEAKLLEFHNCSCDSWEMNADQDVWNALAEEVNKRAGL